MWSLTKDDLNWDRPKIRVIYGKGQKERQIPFDGRCQYPMSRYLRQCKDSLDWLWVTEAGNRIAYDSIWQDLNRAAQQAGIKLQDTCHIFRRTFAAHAVKQQIPLDLDILHLRSPILTKCAEEPTNGLHLRVDD